MIHFNFSEMLYVESSLEAGKWMKILLIHNFMRLKKVFFNTRSATFSELKSVTRFYNIINFIGLF